MCVKKFKTINYSKQENIGTDGISQCRETWYTKDEFMWILAKKNEHFDYFKSFFDEIFYNQKDEKIRKSIGSFFSDLFDTKKPFTKSDIDMISSIYKMLDKHMKK